jgi:hypothetical protein
MAADWYDAGGVLRAVVMTLYELLAREFCDSSECDQVLLFNCTYECFTINWERYHADDGYHFGYVYEFWCCCDREPLGPPLG